MASAAAGHYYSHPSNQFWKLLAATHITPQQLSPTEDATLPEFGVGLTDLVKTRAESDDRNLRPEDFDVQGFIAKIERHSPTWLAVNGIGTTGANLAAALGHRKPAKGQQLWTIGATRVWILPQSGGRSPAPRLPDWAAFAEQALGITQHATAVRATAQSTKAVAPSVMAGALTPADLSTELGVPASAIRRYARDQGWRDDETKGSSWDFTAEQASAIRANLAGSHD